MKRLILSCNLVVVIRKGAFYDPLLHLVVRHLAQPVDPADQPVAGQQQASIVGFNAAPQVTLLVRNGSDDALVCPYAGATLLTYPCPVVRRRLFVGCCSRLQERSCMVVQ